MAIGRTFQESVQKALRSLATGADGFNEKLDLAAEGAIDTLRHQLRVPGPERIWYVGDAFRAGLSGEEIYELSHIDPWFLAQIEELIELEQQVKSGTLALDRDGLYFLKQ